MPDDIRSPPNTTQRPTRDAVLHALNNTIRVTHSSYVPDIKTEDERHSLCVKERLEVLYDKRRRAREEFDRISAQRDGNTREAFEDLARGFEMDRRYLELNNHLAHAESEYSAFNAEVVEGGLMCAEQADDDLRCCSDRKTLEELQKEANTAQHRVMERYEHDLRQANEARLKLANKNLELMRKLTNAATRIEELESEAHDLNILIREAAEKFAALGYTWVHGAESDGTSFL